MFTVNRETMDQISAPVGRFFASHTGKELLKGAVPRGVSIGPLSRIQDLMEDECLNARHFWKEIEHPELGKKIPYPGEFVRSSAHDLSVKFRAPLIGEHNTEIFSRIGLSAEDLVVFKQAGII
jgi:formyl-CoA transferase